MCFTKQNVKDVSGMLRLENALQHYKDPVITLNLCILSTSNKVSLTKSVNI